MSRDKMMKIKIAIIRYTQKVELKVITLEKSNT